MHRIGIDIGGTFTDFTLIDDRDGSVATHKQLTSPDDPSRTVLEGIAELLAETGVDIGAVATVVHGTTLVTNALIERRGSRTGMLVTAGMRDILDIGRERRYDLFDLRLVFPEPVVARHLRREVAERVRYDGSVEVAPDLDAAVAAVRELVEEWRIEALAICLLHSYANPEHERLVAERVAREFPDLYVSTSAEVCPAIREYERWTTTTMNAYVQPVVDRYIARIEDQLAAMGFRGRFYIMTSSGGMVTPQTARRFPIRLLESGPAAGAIMSGAHGKSLAIDRILSFDMGGTTAKGALVRGGKPLKKYELEVARVHQFKEGSGLPAKAPVIDMIEIGAGGGSIAAIDERGVIAVGPKSAGARPGPACYGQGGTLPTLTDANLTLGYLDADFFLGGKMRLDRGAAETAIAAHVGAPLGIDALRAAWGIHETINEDVARAFRVHASERAFDYRNSSMVGFGGSGPIHAVRIARKLNIPRVIFPRGAGVMSAFGLLVSPLSFELARSRRQRLDRLDQAGCDEAFRPMVAAASALLEESGVPAADITVARKLDVRYEGQGYEVEISADGAAAALPGRFFETYREVCSSMVLDEPLEIVNWKVEASGPPPVDGVDFNFPDGVSGAAAIKGRRAAYDPDAGTRDAMPVYDRYALKPGDRFVGPALVEELESTLLIGRGDAALVDERLSIVVHVASKEERA